MVVQQFVNLQVSIVHAIAFVGISIKKVTNLKIFCHHFFLLKPINIIRGIPHTPLIAIHSIFQSLC